MECNITQRYATKLDMVAALWSVIESNAESPRDIGDLLPMKYRPNIIISDNPHMTHLISIEDEPTFSILMVAEYVLLRWNAMLSGHMKALWRKYPSHGSIISINHA